MKGFVHSVLVSLTLIISGTAFGQDEEPQLAEYLPNSHQESVQAWSTAKLERAFHAMYDLDFGTADLELNQFVAQRPTDPLGPAGQAADILFSLFEQHHIVQSEFFSSDDHYAKRQTITPDQALLRRFEERLQRAEKLARLSLAKNAVEDENALFALTLVYGLRADYAALVDHRDLAALRFSNTANHWARKLLSVSPQFSDAYVATGIQKYLVSLRPAPIRWMLRIGGIRGDREEGFRDLEVAASTGRYLAPFARIVLAVAHLRQRRQQDAIQLLAGLRQQFPHNRLFREELARLKQSDLPSPQGSPLPSE